MVAQVQVPCILRMGCNMCAMCLPSCVMLSHEAIKAVLSQEFAGISVRRRRQLWVFAAKKVSSHLARRSYSKPRHVLACLCSHVVVHQHWSRTLCFDM